MDARFALPLTLLFLPLAACGGGDGVLPKAAPEIELFEASPSMVEAGQSTTLRYRVGQAVTVRIDVMNGPSVLPSTANSEGEVATPALTDTTTFVLVATSLTGRSATASLTVQVTKEQAPQIVSFSASPAMIDAGNSTTLSWQIEGATSARIEVQGTTIFTVPNDAIANGTFMHGPAQTTTYTLVATNAQGEESRGTTVVTVNGAMPVVRSFRATPPTIDAGMSTVLSWEVANATQVTITDDANNTVYSGSDLTGSRSVSPSTTTRYALSASDGAEEATQSVVVSVNAPAGASIVRFGANPTSILAGQDTTLEWEVQNAPGGIQITANGVVVTATNLESGTTVVMPAMTTTYELAAINPNGNATRSLTVTVTPPAGPTILAFSANPNPTAASASTALSWRTLAATRVRLLEGGTVLLDTATMVGQGTFSVSPAADTTYTLEASDGAQTSVQRLRVYAHPAPTINSFTVTPMDITGPTALTVAWNVSNYAQLSLTMDGAPVPGFSVPTSTAAARNSQGTLQVQVTQAALFELTATSAGGTRNASVQVGTPVVGAEAEPNDDLAGANPFDQGGRITGDLTAGDFDYFRIMVPEGGNVRAETSDGMGGCSTDTVVFLLDAAGEVLTADDDGGTTPCSLIDPITDPDAANLAAGTYYLVVRHFDATGTGNYVLNVRIAGPTCGNQIVESAEQCDFGDLSDGDGCSSTCQLEINPTVISGTGGTVTLNLQPSQFAIVRIDVLNGQAISAVAADAGGTTCNTVDTGINFGDSSFTLLGQKLDGGPTGTAGNCAAITYPVDAFAADLAAGSHYLLVFNQGTTGGSVVLAVAISDPVCGNGLHETRSEQCDDGNTAAGDLCNATCNLEVSATVTVPGTGPSSVQGSLNAPNFAQLIRIDVTSEVYLTVETFAPNRAGGCPSPSDTVVELYSQNLTFLGGDDDGGIGRCSSFGAVAPFSRVAPGTYYLLVYDFGADTAIPVYEVSIGSVSLPASPAAVEVEANDDQATAMRTGLAGAGTVHLHGQISPEGDDDVYSFVVPAGQTRMVTARTYDAPGTPSACAAGNAATDTRIFLEAAGAPATGPNTGLAYNDDRDPAANIWCSAIGPTAVTAGAQDTRFYVRVQGFDDEGERFYFLEIDVQ